MIRKGFGQKRPPVQAGPEKTEKRFPRKGGPVEEGKRSRGTWLTSRKSAQTRRGIREEGKGATMKKKSENWTLKPIHKRKKRKELSLTHQAPINNRPR